MSDDEIKLTTTNNTTSNGTPYPETPKPQILKEHFSFVELNNLNDSSNKNRPNND